MTIQQTYIMFKPGLMGEIISQIEVKGYQIVQVKMMTLNKEIIAQHYAHLVDKDFYPKLEAFMLSGPVLAMVVEGHEAIQGMRNMMTD